MQEEGKVAVRREKFKEAQAISQFKACMGLGLGSIRQRMLGTSD